MYNETRGFVNITVRSSKKEGTKMKHLLVVFTLLIIVGCGGVVHYGIHTAPADQVDSSTVSAIKKASNSSDKCVVEVKDRKILETYENGSTREKLFVDRCGNQERFEVRYIKRPDGTVMVTARKI